MGNSQVLLAFEKYAKADIKVVGYSVSLLDFLLLFKIFFTGLHIQNSWLT